MKKLTGHIGIKGAAVIAAVVFFSAFSHKSRTQIISGLTETEVKPDNLPNRANVAFKEGEVLTYRMHYGLINAGVAILEVKPDLIQVNDRKVYHIVGNGYTTGATDWF